MKRFIDNKNGTVTDTKAGLMWQKDTAPNSYTWREAKTYCKKLKLAGHKDWRLPNIQELQSIVDYSKHNPACNSIFGVVSSYHWSSTTHAYNTHNTWSVHFYHGLVNYNLKSYNYYVRAVRGKEKK